MAATPMAMLRFFTLLTLPMLADRMSWITMPTTMDTVNSMDSSWGFFGL